MATVHKTALVPHSADAMFDLVATVGSYPDFLPWCSGAREVERTDGHQVATVDIDFHGVRQSFTTVNALERPTRIGLKLKSGPFSHLSGQWTFKALAEDACRVDFELDYAMRSGLLATLLGPVFGRIAQSMVDSFVTEAERRSGG